MTEQEARAERQFNSIKDRLIAATGSPGMTSFHGGKVHMTLAEWDRLVLLAERSRLSPRVVPTVDEWRAAMDAERARQIEKGYDDEHDRRHGVAHRLRWAIDYARRGKSVESATMIRQALETLNRTEVAP